MAIAQTTNTHHSRSQGCELQDLPQLLRIELTKRISSNPRYSMRAFAKAIAVSPSMLSMILNGKANLSEAKARKIVESLGIFLVTETKSLRPAPIRKKQRNSEYQTVDMDFFIALSEWYHFAILSLLDLPQAQCEPQWISRKLGISVVQAKLAIQRLKTLDLIREKNGRWIQTGGPIRIRGTNANAASRHFQKQMLAKALFSLENQGPEVRDISSMTFKMNKKDFDYAVDLIAQFRRGLSDDLEAKSTPTDVYNLTVQLIPLTSSNLQEKK
jgi:transcriptional regulator with XRE-family HTH domain